MDELTPQSAPKDKFIVGADIGSYRDGLVSKYREKYKGVLQKISENTNMSSDDILSSIVVDILLDSENLLGTQLLFAEQGNLKDSTDITMKRGNLLKAVADIVTKRKELNQKAADIDLNGPSFMLFQKMCFERMVDVLQELNIDVEMVQLILNKWQQKMENWGKDLKNQLEEMAQ